MGGALGAASDGRIYAILISMPKDSGSGLAVARNDWTVSILVSGLRPFTRYSYRFTDEASGKSSATGHAKTAGGNPARVRLGVASCSSLWSATAFSAFRSMAAANLDLVVHLGDYIYSDVDKDERLRVPDFYSSCASAKKNGCEAKSLSEWRWVLLCGLCRGVLRSRVRASQQADGSQSIKTEGRVPPLPPTRVG